MAEPKAKRQKTHQSTKANSEAESGVTDSRFASFQTDPRYRLPSKQHKQVTLDKRFSRILKDEDFSRKAKVDRYGRPTENNSEKQRLKRQYQFDIEDAETDEPDDDAEVLKELRRVEKTHDPLRDGLEINTSSDESSSDEDEDVDSESELDLGAEETDPIPMGEVSSRLAVVNLDWDNIRAADLMAVFASFLPNTDHLSKVTIYPSEYGKERMEREEMEGPPKDIFVPSNHTNEVAGPEPESEDDNEEKIKDHIVKADAGEEFDSAKLRQYQLDRLRYFYAILSFSSTSAAQAVYEAVDGTEYLSTANFFDLRFVPDGTDFSTDKPHEECDRIPDGYKPNDFVTDALQHSKVRLTWDAEDVSRKEAQARAFRGGRKDIDENDLKAYLGTDSSEDEQDEAESGPSKKDQERQKMRALLGLGAEPAKRTSRETGPVGDLQITFSSGLADSNGKKSSVFENDPIVQESTLEKYVRKERERKQQRKERTKNTATGTKLTADTQIEGNVDAEDEDMGFDDPFFEPENDKVSASKMRKEERMKKRAEREADEAASAAKRAELELLMVDDKKTDLRHFDMNEIEKAERRAKRGRKGKKHESKEISEPHQAGFSMDTQDPRFDRLYENHEFAIDPTNPRYKDTQGMKALLDEGRKRRKGGKQSRDTSKAAVEPPNETRTALAGQTSSDVKSLIDKVKRRA